MKNLPARLPADAPHGFSGRSIDRNRPITFQLNGRTVTGFEGDTVLSALLASGVDTIGTHLEEPIALTPKCHPPIMVAGSSRDVRAPLPMDRTPALNGASLVTIGGGRKAGLFNRLFQPQNTLGLELGDTHAWERPWRDTFSVSKGEAGLVVIGGGVAGMAAALTAAQAGLSVIILEASAQLGGHSGLFGTQEGEDTPEECVARLTADIDASDAITVYCRSQVFALRSGRVRLHQVVVDGATPRGHIMDIETSRIVLAPGSLERQPIFAGNRLPGVIGSLDAYELATRYAVWPGRSSVMATATNATYRLAKLVRDAGIEVDRILDSRDIASSRFIEFTKAYGIRQFPGHQPHYAEQAKSGDRLTLAYGSGENQKASTPRLVISGGWQPDLSLWHAAGGLSQWDPVRLRLEPRGNLDGIVLAGSAAGYLTRRGCIQSGADAVNILLDHQRFVVEDPVIDAVFETPDGALPIGPADKGELPAYLDGSGFLQRPQAGPPEWWHFFRKPRAPELPALSEASQPLSIGEVAAGVSLGLIPAASAGIVAQERVALVPISPSKLEPEPTSPSPQDPLAVPNYLVGRFGDKERLMALVTEDGRSVESGALLYRSSDVRSPLDAVGVVVRIHKDTVLAYVSGDIEPSNKLTIRDHGRPVTARVELLGEMALS